MGLYAICCFGIILILLLVLIVLCVSFLIISKKFGFKKAVKSKGGIIILVLLAIFIGGPAVFIYSFMTPHSGDQLVRIYLLNPVPKSVEVIDSYDGGPDLVPETCLHFIIAPADLKLILDAKKWELVNDTKYSGAQCDYRNSAWNFSFPPPALGEKVKTYYFSPYNKDYEYLFVNVQMNEVYYFNIDSGLP